MTEEVLVSIKGMQVLAMDDGDEVEIVTSGNTCTKTESLISVMRKSGRNGGHHSESHKA